MSDLECTIEVMEQPAEKVKFRMEVHSHRCQRAELLLGRTGMPDDQVTFPKVRVVPKPGCSLRPGTLVRMSLVDVRSTSDRIIDHWHRLVDCKEARLAPRWAVVKQVELPYGWVIFSTLGVVKSLERDRAQEVGERAVKRLEERGNIVRGHKHTELEVKDRAEERCRETCAFRLKLCFEAYLPGQQGTIVPVAEPIFSEIILDETRPDKTGDLPIQKISCFTDSVEGGQEIMVFTGNDTTKIFLKRSNLYVEFFELNDNHERLWKSGRIPIPKSDLHGLGQVLGGLSFRVPVYDRSNPGTGRATQIDVDTINVFFEIVKTNRAGKEEAKSDPLYFVYKPSKMNSMTNRIRGKRSIDPEYFLQFKKAKEEVFVPQFNPTEIFEIPENVPIINLPKNNPFPISNIPITVESINKQHTICYPSSPQHPSPMSPCTAMETMTIRSPNPQPPTQESNQSPLFRRTDAPDQLYQPSPADMNQTYPPTLMSPSFTDQNDQPMIANGQPFDIDNFINGLLVGPSEDGSPSQVQNTETLPQFGDLSPPIIHGNILFDGHIKAVATICSDSSTIPRRKETKEENVTVKEIDKDEKNKTSSIKDGADESSNNKDILSGSFKQLKL